MSLILTVRIDDPDASPSDPVGSVATARTARTTLEVGRISGHYGVGGRSDHWSSSTLVRSKSVDAPVLMPWARLEQIAGERELLSTRAPQMIHFRS